jgi:hypothetical protein
VATSRRLAALCLSVLALFPLGAGTAAAVATPFCEGTVARDYEAVAAAAPIVVDFRGATRGIDAANLIQL